ESPHVQNSLVHNRRNPRRKPALEQSWKFDLVGQFLLWQFTVAVKYADRGSGMENCESSAATTEVACNVVSTFGGSRPWPRNQKTMRETASPKGSSSVGTGLCGMAKS